MKDLSNNALARALASLPLLCLPLLHCSKDTSVSVGTECNADSECIDDGNPCTTETCNEGKCSHPHAPNQTSCPDGLCWAGACCKGCWDGTICKAGADVGECGRGGLSCATCEDDEPCTTDTCVGGVCENAAANEGGACPGGTCRSGVCCGGCWDGAACRNGQSDVAACGLSGAPCLSCTADACMQPVCEQGICGEHGVQDGTVCLGGFCQGGACCTGCWDESSSTCASGLEAIACGGNGETCQDCSDENPCTLDACDSGVCSAPVDLQGTACPLGVCVAGQCQPCGDFGEVCCAGDSCDGGMQCIGGSCGGCGATGQVCCPGNACQAGNLCRNGTCVACGADNELCCANGVCNAGLTCDAMDKCTPCGGSGQPCCEGDCGAWLVCEAGSCTPCGAAGQVCCATGPSCDGASLACDAGTCSHCGERGEVCCNADNCVMWAMCSSGACAGCGHPGEPCCHSGTCDSYGTCEASGCHGCGQQIEPGNDHICAIRQDQTLWCWGANSAGQLGTGNTSGSPDPVQVAIPGGGPVVQVATGTGRTCARKQDDTLWCWGQSSLSPVQISPGGVGGVKDVALGGDRICARKADNTLWCWTTGSPVQVLIPGGRIPAVVAVGEHHACASATDFTLWCWGANDRGQLGNGSTTPSETPVQVLWLTGTPLVQDVTAGGSHTCAVSSDQKLWCWGDNQFGQLGRGNTSAQPSPSPDEVSVLGASVLDVTAGASHTCALRNSGTAWCFGANNAGQIGDEGTLPQPTPVQAAAFDSPVTVVNAGATRTCVAHAAAFWCTNRVGSQAPTVDLVELPCP